ncbi:MAG: translational GTPase TypA [bacterium]|nr:translational GTPase TypA [bacterium]
MIKPDKIRNVAIIAHVDHGKTTLVDGLLRQSKTFRENQAEMMQNLIMDTGELERERGITISAKTTAIEYEGYKINIIDTPGHADFSGEVERTLNMADGCLLIVDAQEGPMPQTKFVLSKALELGLKPIVVINKIDKAAAHIAEAVEKTSNLFLDLAVHDKQLDFPVYYSVGRDGKVFSEVPSDSSAEGDLTPLFDAIIKFVPAPKVDQKGPFQMLITSLDWDSYQGKYAIGRISRGSIKPSDPAVLIDINSQSKNVKVDKLFVAKGLGKIESNVVGAGDIVCITGIDTAKIGATLSDPAHPEALPSMEIEAPTLQIAIGPNTSPFAGKEGRFTTSRQIASRLQKELETNVGLRVEARGTSFLVSGRGELHLSVLIETMRREGYELEIGRPQVVTKKEGGKILEPLEELTLEVAEEYSGNVTSELGKRRAELLSMEPNAKGATEIIYHLPTRAMLGLRSQLLTATKGTVIMNSLLAGYQPLGKPLQKLRNGVLISFETGAAITYSLKNLEERGTAFVGPGARVYQGMIIGLNRRGDDMEINICREKKLTNIRASSTDMTTQLTPYTELSLEEAVDFIEDDELLEVTPKNIRMRKKYLTPNERKKHTKK